MATKVIAGKTVQVNDEGFMTNPAEWTKEMAPEIAKEEGIAELTADHWKVIDFSRDASKGLGGKSPTLRQITTGTAHDQRPVRIVPEGPGQEGRVYRRAGQTGRVCLSLETGEQVDWETRKQGEPSLSTCLPDNKGEFSWLTKTAT